MLKRLIRQLIGSAGSAVSQTPEPDPEFTLPQALALMRSRDYAGAARVCEELIARDAAVPGPWELLGAIALERGENDRARERFDTALGLAGDTPQALCNAAEANRQAGRQARALELCARALALDAGSAPAMHIQALTLQSCWRMDEALALYQRLVREQPDVAQAFAGYLFQLVLQGEHPLEVRAAHCRWSEIHAEPLRGPSTGWANAPEAQRRLRIGYVSADFREHAASSFIEPIFAAHDSGNFEIYCYSNTEKIDAVTERLRVLADCWRDVRWQGDDAVAGLVRADAIDILVDLSGHSSGNRLGIFARKPAPVQLTYLGYAATTGMRAMDCRVCDALLDPPGVADTYYTERLLRLPHSMWCFRPQVSMPDPGPLPALRAGMIT
ncbi:MAG: hypothetical protein D4R74_04815, partial [Betaproteobacteria bacterium]